jgi:hypothetical protein
MVIIEYNDDGGGEHCIAGGEINNIYHDVHGAYDTESNKKKRIAYAASKLSKKVNTILPYLSEISDDIDLLDQCGIKFDNEKSLYGVSPFAFELAFGGRNKHPQLNALAKEIVES